MIYDISGKHRLKIYESLFVNNTNHNLQTDIRTEYNLRTEY